MNLVTQPLGELIAKYGMVEYIRDYYAAINGRLKMLYTRDDFAYFFGCTRYLYAFLKED